LDAEAGAPEHDDQPASSIAVENQRITAMTSSVRGGSAG
jgi:hypothetical protein